MTTSKDLLQPSVEEREHQNFLAWIKSIASFSWTGKNGKTYAVSTRGHKLTYDENGRLEHLKPPSRK